MKKLPDKQVVTPVQELESTPKIHWSIAGRSIVSLFVVVHLLAVFAEPFAMFSRSTMRPSASDSGWLRGLLAPYVEMFYLDHGYFFFAPNPGPNHLVECRYFPKEGAAQRELASIVEPALKERFPDRKVHWPRLYYHRHFMLSEFYYNNHAWTDQPIEAREDPRIDREWRSELARYLRLQASIVRHLETQHPDHRVELRRYEHHLPNEYRVLKEGWGLDDPRLYELVPESLQERDSIEAKGTAGSFEPNPETAPGIAPRMLRAEPRIPPPGEFVIPEALKPEPQK